MRSRPRWTIASLCFVLPVVTGLACGARTPLGTPPDELDAALDVGGDVLVRDTSFPDTCCGPDTFVPDTFAPDTFVPDTFVPDTALDTLETDTSVPPFTFEVVLGGFHSCARLGAGALRCWGQDLQGQLGDGSGSDAGSFLPDQPAPVSVVGLVGALQITAGNDHTCAVMSDHTVSCWGANDDGQLGPGVSKGSEPHSTPVTVPGLVGVQEVQAGAISTCARLADGTVRCWGRGLGAGVGTAVAGLASVARIVVGREHACALITDGTVSCWGANESGQLGDGSIVPHDDARPVPGITGATFLGTGGHHTCVVTAGALRCWGNNTFGQLGDGTTSDRLSPIAVAGLGSFSQVSLGYEHSCARRTDSSVMCWGHNVWGQLGDGTNTSRSVPTLVPGLLADYVASGSSALHTCSLTSGVLRCWGASFHGEVGDGSFAERDTPTLVKW